MMISFIKGGKLSKPTWPYMKNELSLAVHERTVINHIILESWVKFH